jgi:transposase
MDKEQTYAGVDVSKDYLDVTIVDSDKTWRFANSQTGIKKIIKVFKGMTSVMVVFEFTGGLNFHFGWRLPKLGLMVHQSILVRSGILPKLKVNWLRLIILTLK